MKKLISFRVETRQNDMIVDMMIFGWILPVKHNKITSPSGLNNVYLPHVWWNYTIPGPLIRAMDEFLGIPDPPGLEE